MAETIAVVYHADGTKPGGRLTRKECKNLAEAERFIDTLEHSGGSKCWCKLSVGAYIVRTPRKAG